MGEAKRRLHQGFDPNLYRRKVGEAVFAAIPPIEGTVAIESAIVTEALLEIVGLLMAPDPRRRLQSRRTTLRRAYRRGR
jgi:hypothetical protein